MAEAPLNRGLRLDNRRMVLKLAVIVAAMGAFGYALVPLYRTICNALGINVLSVSERIGAAGLGSTADQRSSQIDYSRKVVIEFDGNARGPWAFAPARRSIEVHPGEMATVMYEFRNSQDRTMAAQAIPSYAPRQSASHFHKVECFCFNEYVLKPGEARQWPVVFYIDPKLPQDVTTITLSYTFFEVPGKVLGQAPAPALSGRSGS